MFKLLITDDGEYTKQSFHISEYRLDVDFLEKFTALLQNNPEEIESLIKGLVTDIISRRDVEPDIIRSVFLGLLLEAVCYADKMMTLDLTFKAKIFDLLTQQRKCKTLYELADSFCKNIWMVFGTAMKNTTPNSKIKEVMSFIDIHYSEFSLGVNTIANKLYISSNYLSTLFKKVTRKTLNDYINEVRIKKAKELLLDSQIKMYEVAELTGFSDSNYFSTIFKKHTGCSPSQYRNLVSGSVD